MIGATTTLFYTDGEVVEKKLKVRKTELHFRIQVWDRLQHKKLKYVSLRLDLSEVS